MIEIKPKNIQEDEKEDNQLFVSRGIKILKKN